MGYNYLALQTIKKKRLLSRLALNKMKPNAQNEGYYGKIALFLNNQIK